MKFELKSVGSYSSLKISERSLVESHLADHRTLLLSADAHVVSFAQSDELTLNKV